MNFLYKSILYLIFVVILFFQQNAYAGSIKIDRFASSIVLTNKILQPINISIISPCKWKVLVQALDSRIVNQDNPSYSIPITRIELAETSGAPVSNLGCGKIVEINSGLNQGMSNLNLALATLFFENDRPGNYSTDIRFTLVDENNVQTDDIYNLRFKINEVSKVNFLRKVSTIQLSKENTLKFDSQQNMETPLGVYVSSNKNWKLYINKIAGAKESPLRYSVKVLGGDSSVNCNTSGEYIPLNQNRILIASGKATFNDAMKCLDKKLINIDYLITSPKSEFLEPGLYSTDFEYRLETED